MYIPMVFYLIQALSVFDNQQYLHVLTLYMYLPVSITATG